MKVKTKSQDAAKSAKKPTLLNSVKFNSPTLAPRKQSSSAVQFYKSPSLATQQGKDESSLGSLLKKMKQVQTPTTVKVREVRDEIHQKLQNLLKLGCKRGQEFILGFNSISKLAEQSLYHTEEGISKNIVSVICISSDAKGELVHSLGQVAALKNIPIVLLPKISPMLQECFQLKRAFCFALRESSHVTDTAISTQKLGQLDDLKEYLIRLSLQ